MVTATIARVDTASFDGIAVVTAHYADGVHEADYSRAFTLSVSVNDEIAEWMTGEAARYRDEWAALPAVVTSPTVDESITVEV